MQYDLIPQALHADFDQFLQALTELSQPTPSHCPYCAHKSVRQTRAAPLTFRCKACLKYFNPLTNTPFNRLSPADWLPLILCDRVNRQTYQEIADTLDCDIKKIMRRDKAIKNKMQIDFPNLHQWYCAHNDVAHQFTANTTNDTLAAQHLAFKQKLSELLTTTHAHCLYCHSPKTVKVGQRATFRCDHCRRGFSLLNGTPISNLTHADQWLNYIDLLVAKQSNHAIAEQLGINKNTIASWRRKWCRTMQLWGVESLAIWCKRR